MRKGIKEPLKKHASHPSVKIEMRYSNQYNRTGIRQFLSDLYGSSDKPGKRPKPMY